MITFQCNPGLSPEGVMTATCTNAGVWSPDPADVICKNITGMHRPTACILHVHQYEGRDGDWAYIIVVWQCTHT